jgi:hypothetical protein
MLRYYTVFNAEQTEGCRLPADASDKIVESAFSDYRQFVAKLYEAVQQIGKQR